MRLRKETARQPRICLRCQKPLKDPDYSKHKKRHVCEDCMKRVREAVDRAMEAEK